MHTYLKNEMLRPFGRAQRTTVRVAWGTHQIERFDTETGQYTADHGLSADCIKRVKSFLTNSVVGKWARGE